MRFIRRLLPVTAFVTLFGFAPQGLRAEERTRFIPAANARYTLPGDDWDWVDPPLPDASLTAANERGDTLALWLIRIEGSGHVTPALAAEFEQGLARGQLQKRGGQFTAFQGRPCYQLEGVYPNGRKSVSRLFLVNGVAFHLILVGGDRRAIEQDPDLEIVMGGIAVAEPPAREADGSGIGIAFVVAVIFIVCLVVGLIVRAQRSAPRRAVPAAWLSLGDDFLRVRPQRGIAAVRNGFGATAEMEHGEDFAPAGQIINREAKKTGKCRRCGRGPVEVDASRCPWCGGGSPNPSRESRYAGRGLFLGALLGAGLGVLGGLIATGGAPAMIGGGFLGALAGAIVGLAGGTMTGIVARWRGSE